MELMAVAKAGALATADAAAAAEGPQTATATATARAGGEAKATAKKSKYTKGFVTLQHAFQCLSSWSPMHRRSQVSSSCIVAHSTP